MTKEEFSHLLDRYVQGTATPDERALFGRFIERMTAQSPEWELQDAERIKLEMYDAIRRQMRVESAPAKIIVFPGWLRVACAAAAILIIGLFIYNMYQRPGIITIATHAGERDTVKLTDGSVIYLNESSQVTYTEGFQRNKRSVSLSGEAFFEVASDKKRPFSVDAAGYRTIALGTSFNVRAHDSSDLRVSLVTGKVEVSALLNGESIDGTAHRLLPGHQLRYSVGERKVFIEDFDPAFALAWRDNKISFENEPLDQVLASLEQQYHVNISFNKKVMHNCTVNGIFERSESIYTILNILTFSNNLHFTEQQHSRFIITGKGCE